MNNDYLFYYLVGAIDSRGFYTLASQFVRNRLGNLRPKWPHSFQFHTIRKKTCVQLKEMFGGIIVLEKKKSKGRQVFKWQIFGNELTLFCERIAPYLFILKEETYLMIEFRSTYNKPRGYLLLDEEVNKRNLLTKKFKDIYKTIGQQ